MDLFLNFTNYLPVNAVLYEFIMAIFIKVTLILCAAFAVTLIWKRASSSTRHLVWFFAFVCILIMPLFSFIMSAWEIGFFTLDLTSSSPQPQDIIFSPLDSEETNLFSHDSNLERPINSNSENTPLLRKDLVRQNNGGIISNAVSMIQNIFNRLPWSVLLLLVWMVGALCVFVQLIIKLTGLWLMVKKSAPLQDPVFNNLIVDCKKRTGLKRNIRLLKSKWVTVPVAWGLFRPVIVVPKGAELWPDKQKEIVLLHEFAHIKRADFLSTIIAHVASVVYWCNPLIWIALRRFHFERENACDDYVLSLGTKPSVYARNLFEVAQAVESMKWASHLGLAIVRKNKLEGRVMEILNSTKQRSVLKPATMLLVGLLAVSLLIPVSSIQTRAQKESTLVPSEAYDEYQGIVLRQIWAGTDVDFYGETSPDGSYLSYVDWETGDLAILELATGKKRRLTNKGSWDDPIEFAEFSRWSPDGKQIVYDWYNDDNPAFIDLYIIGLDGSKPRMLYSNEEMIWAQCYDWSPDGKQILACLTGKDGKNKIVLVSVADGSVRVLSTLGQQGEDNWPKNMSFSPDGIYIVYDYPQKEDSRDHDIYLLSTDGSREIPLVEHPANDFVLGWAPNGKNVLFASDRTGTLGAWLIAVADGKPQGTPELVKPDIGRFVPLGFIQKGSFYYGISKGRDDVYIATLDHETGKILVPPKKLMTRSEDSNIACGYSPDGKYLAYIYNRSRSNVLCIRSLETGKEREFSLNLDNIIRHSSPRWSPDCRSILVLGGNNWDGYGIYKIDVQTGDVTCIVQNGHSGVWSHDGKSIFYLRIDRKAEISQILVRDLETGKEKEFYLSPGDEYEPRNISLSPDGQWLALRCISPRSLKVMPVTGGEPRELPEFEKVASIHEPIAWTADGKYIIFSGKEPGGGKNPLYRISSESGKIDILGLNMMNRYHSLSVHPNGKHIAFSSWDPTGKPAEIWVMENFLPEIKN